MTNYENETSNHLIGIGRLHGIYIWSISHVIKFISDAFVTKTCRMSRNSVSLHWISDNCQHYKCFRRIIITTQPITLRQLYDNNLFKVWQSYFRSVYKHWVQEKILYFLTNSLSDKMALFVAFLCLMLLITASSHNGEFIKNLVRLNINIVAESLVTMLLHYIIVIDLMQPRSQTYR